MKINIFRFSLYAWGFILIFFFSSCYQDLIDDFSKKTELDYDAKWAANIVNTEANLSDFNLEMGDDANFTIENVDNILVLTYNTTKLYSLRGDTMYHASLETSNFSFELPAPTGGVKNTKATYSYTIDKNIKLTLDGMILDSALFKSGILTINITSDLNHPYAITLKSDYILDENKQKLNMTKFPTTPNVFFTIDIKNKYGIFPYGQNSIPVRFEIEITPDSDPLTFPYHFNVSNTLPNVTFSWLHGQSQTKTEHFSQALSMMFLEDDATLHCKAHSAKVHIDIRNNVGMPLSVDIDSVIVCNPLDNVYIPLITINELLTANYPIVKGEYATTTRSFDIEDFLYENRTSYIYFAGTGILNNNGIDGNKYFITDSSRYRIHTRVEVPLKIDLYNLSYFDTLTFSMDSINVNELESAIFRIQLENNFAFGIKSQVYFLDKTYKPIDSLFATPLALPKATVDPNDNYHVIQSSSDSKKITVTNERMQKIVKAAYIVIRADANVNKNDPYMIFYHNEQKLGIKLGVQAHVKAKLESF